MEGLSTSGQVGALNVAVDGQVLGQPYVMATSGRGFNADELAQMCLNKVFYVSADLPPDKFAEAHAYRDKLLGVLTYYMTQAQKSQNTSVYNVLMNAGHPQAAELVKEL